MAQVDFSYTKGHDVSVIHIELIAQAPLSEVHKTFARKLIRNGTFDAADLANEIRAVDKLCRNPVCPNIVPVLSHAWLDNGLYYAIDMELCDATLHTWIANQGQLAFEQKYNGYGGLQICWIMTEICEGVKYIHESYEIHRDLKPQNVLLSGGRWKIADFAFATPGASNPELYSLEVRGTTCYRAPELILQHMFTRKVDIWALGCILYQMVTGHVLFQEDFYVRQYAAGNSQVELPPLPWPHSAPQAQAQIQQCLADCLNRHPAARPTAENLLRRFQQLETNVSQ